LPSSLHFAVKRVDLRAPPARDVLEHGRAVARSVPDDLAGVLQRVDACFYAHGLRDLRGLVYEVCDKCLELRHLEQRAVVQARDGP